MRRRHVVVVLLVGLLAGLGAACELHPEYRFVVDLATDAGDAVLGDGICSTVGPDPGCTLRAAVDETRELSLRSVGPSPLITVELAADPVLDTYGDGGAEDNNQQGDLDIIGVLTLEGGGHTIDGGGIDRVFDLLSGEVVLRHVTVTGGLAPDSGGAVRTATGTRVTVIGSTFHDNTAKPLGLCQQPSGGSPTCATIVGPVGGGALFVQGSGVVVASTFSRNSAVPWGQGCTGPEGGASLCAVAWGGAILSTGELYVGISTFDDNVNQGPHPDWEGGGAIFATASAQVVSSTVSDNGTNPVTAVVGATVESSIVVSTACGPPMLVSGGNLRSPLPCGAPAPTWLGPLADNGGDTATRSPVAGSPGVDAIAWADCLGYSADQRGEPRAADESCDVGAVERQPTDP